MFRESCSFDPAVGFRTLQGPPAHPQLHCVSGARAWGVKSAIAQRNLRLASVGGLVCVSKSNAAMQALPALRPHAALLRTRNPVLRLWGFPPLRWMLYRGGAASVLWLRGKRHSELQWLCEVEGSEGGSCKASARRHQKERGPQTNLPLQKLSGPVPLPSRWAWARGGITLSERGVQSRLPRIHPPTHILIPLPTGHEGAREAYINSHQGHGQASKTWAQIHSSL